MLYEVITRFMVVIIPAYQPDDKLSRLVHELHEKTSYDLIIVNDGSDADKRPLFDSLEPYAKIIHHSVNRVITSYSIHYTKLYERALSCPSRDAASTCIAGVMVSGASSKPEMVTAYCGQIA